jgi:predicted SAM-dependent methyltransferase
MPIEEGTLRVAYSCHVIEHIRDEDTEYMFQEIHRCLERGGIFRVIFPDADLLYNAYRRGDFDFFYYWTGGYKATSVGQKFLETFATALTQNHPEKRCRKYTDEEVKEIFDRMPKKEALNFLCRQIPIEVQRSFPGDHMNWFNREKVKEMLSKTGFFEIWDSGYAQSKCPLMRNTRLFDNTSPQYSSYVECRK